MVALGPNRGLSRMAVPFLVTYPPSKRPSRVFLLASAASFRENTSTYVDEASFAKL
jgi:hypothetical protein